MPQPLLHTRTNAQLALYSAKPTHALLLTGAKGSGKYYIAQWLAVEQALPVHTVEAQPGKTGITIEQIRELYKVTRTGNRLAVVVKEAQTLSNEAQNAFLKLLEEPPENTQFILTATSPSKLLATIRSRTHQIEVLPPTKTQLKDYAQKIAVQDAAALDSLLYSTKQLPGIFIPALTNGELQKAHQAAIAEAKAFYQEPAYERHLRLIAHGYEVAWVESLLEILVLIVSTLQKTAQTTTQLATLNSQARLLEQTTGSLRANGNPKIHLTKLAAQL